MPRRRVDQAFALRQRHGFQIGHGHHIHRCAACDLL
jgi:hypothetical protein